MKQLHPFEIELNRRIQQDCYTTAYPWNPEDWAQYLTHGPLKFQMDGKISFYIHIPFCMHLCKFCEYTRCVVPDEQAQFNYLKIVNNDIRRFIDKHPDITLEGFDIGGGTPTSLSNAAFAYLMDIYREVVGKVKLSKDFEPSIETSFMTITPEKKRLIEKAGIRRISLGVQSLYFSKNSDGIGWKYPTADEIIRRVNIIKRHPWYKKGFKINLDFMYGFKDHENWEIEDQNLVAIERLRPDQVTLYELRTNQIDGVMSDDAEHRAASYDSWHRMLTGMLYCAPYGQNTFTKSDDLGVSSYLRHRMLEGGDYKGFGISAQSMSDGNVEYNVGKNLHDILSLIPRQGNIESTSFDATTHYELPLEEKLAKFICVSSYSGSFDWKLVEERFMPDFLNRHKDLVDFLRRNGYINMGAKYIRITRKGFKHYGPIFSLFYKPITSTII